MKSKRASPRSRLKAGLMGLLAASAALAAAPTQTALPNLPPSFDSNTLVVLPTPSAPVLDGTVESTWNSARSVDIAAFGASGNWPPANPIRVRALHNATTLFMLFEWADATQDYGQDAWQLINNTTAGGDWVRTGWGDDGLLVFFDNGTGPEFNFSQQGCAGLCHTGAVQEMRTNGSGFVDVWHWSSSRTNALAYADDLYADNGSKVSGSPTGGFHGDAADPNVNNTVTTAYGERPAFINGTLPASSSPRFVLDGQKTALNWTTFNSTSLPNGTTVAGSVLGTPAAGRGDVRAGAAHNGTAWHVELARPYLTGDNASRDVSINDLNLTYYFGLALHNNRTGENHSTAGAAYKLAFAENTLADLNVRAVVLAASPTLIGDPVNLTVAVRNAGFGNSTGPVFVVVRDNETSLDVANGTAPTISWNEEFLVNLSFSSVGYLPGRHNFTAEVDTSNSESESFEANNSFLFAVIFVTTLALADLVVSNATGPTGSVYSGEPFFINGSVANIGQGDSVLNVTVRAFHPTFGNQTVDVGPLVSNQLANVSFSFSTASAAAGTYNFIVRVDPDDRIIETDESNTRPVSVTVDDRPDLVAKSLDADPASGLVGATVVLNLSVINNGAAAAGPLVVWVYLDDGLSTTPTNRTDIWTFNVSLAHGGEHNVSFNWTLPTNLTLGAHLLRAWVDSTDAFAESFETNNNASVQISVRSPPAPDIAITAAVLNQTTYRVGQSGSVSVDITNLGVDYAGDLAVSVIDATANRTLATGTFSPVATNATATLVLTFTLTTGSLGAHSVLIILDPDNSLVEDNELNNAVTLTFTLAPAASPDLTVVRLTYAPSPPTRGDLVRLEAEVRNVGSAASPATSAGFFHGATPLGNVAVPALAPGESAVITFDWNTSAVTSLSVVLAAEADVLEQLTESDEANNRFQISVDFQRPGAPSITISSFSVSASVRTGEPIYINVTVRNNGTAAGVGSLTIRVDQLPVAAYNFSLRPGESINYTVVWNATTTGSHPVRADLALAGSVVEQRQGNADVIGLTPTPPPNFLPLILLVVALAVVSVLFLMRKPKKPADAPAPEPAKVEPPKTEPSAP